MATPDRKKWNSKYTATRVSPPGAPEWLTRHLSTLPRGSALDIATGRGPTAIELAARGWQVTAVDISDVGIRLAEEDAKRIGVRIRWIVADLDAFELPVSRFDLITVFSYLERHRLPAQIIRALRPGGALLYETFTESQLRVPGNHLTNPAHMLRPAELCTMFRPLTIRAYREIELPDRAIASLLGERPA